MLELARCFEQGPVSMSTIAEKQELSRKYLHALLTSLKAAGLVRALRGAGGGYSLARRPADINLNQILNALEGPMALVHCVEDDGACDRAKSCLARDVWTEISDRIEGVLESMTLKDLIERKVKKPGRAGRR